jgi:hypothetical protein
MVHKVNSMSSNNELSKVNLEFRSPRRKVVSSKKEPSELLSSYQKQLTTRLKKTRADSRYDMMTARECGENADK